MSEWAVFSGLIVDGLTVAYALAALWVIYMLFIGERT